MYKVTELFSLFDAPVTTTKPSRVIPTEEFFALLTGTAGHSCREQVERLRDMPKDERNEYKKTRLPFVTPHGTFKTRDHAGFIQASGLYVADFDFYGADMSPFMEDIKADPYVRLAFVGPSGEGSVKVFFRIDPEVILKTPSKQMANVFWAVEGYLRKHYGHHFPSPASGKTLLDKSLQDLPRACFLSYDPDAYLGPADGWRIGRDFIDEYCIPEQKPPTAPTPSRQSKQAVSGEQAKAPGLSLDGLAEKHLVAGESHHHEVTAFVGAAIRFGHTKEAVHVFLREGGWISTESGESNPEKLKETIEYFYREHSEMDPDVVALRDGKIGYRVLCYTWNPKRGYQPEGLYHDGIRRMLEEHGFCRRAVGHGFVLARKQDGVLEEMTKDKIKTFAQKQVEAIGSVTFNAWGQVHTTAEAIMETFLKSSHNLFNDQWLGHLSLDETPMLKDTADAGFIPFGNGVVKVTREGFALHPWAEFSSAVVWKDQLIDHNFTSVEDFGDCHFARFIFNVAGGDQDRIDSMCSALGYMLHHYNRPSEGQSIILNDEALTDLNKPMGGSGKGVFVQAIKVLRKTAKVDGKNFDPNNIFKWQAVGPGTQVVWIDDIKRDFDFSLLHSNLTDGWTIDRKHLPQVQIPPADSPKTIISSNSIVRGEGTTNKRRQFIVEIGDYYSRRIISGLEKPIEEEHGGLFFTEDWPEDEWNKFFTLMLTCFQLYLERGLVHFKGVNIERNRLRQRTSEDFVEWVDAKEFTPNTKHDMKKCFDDFKGIYIGEDPTFKQRTFTNYIKFYAESRGWKVERTRATFNFIDPANPKPRTSEVAKPIEPPQTDGAPVEDGDLPF